MNLSELKKKAQHPISDEEVVNAIEAYDKTVMTNAETAGELLFEAIIPFCIQKPSLTDTLLKYPLEPLFRLGIDDSQKVVRWVELYVEDRKDNLSQEEQAWLKEELPKHTKRIQELLDEYMKSMT